MFNFKLLEERIENDFTFFNVEFSNGKEIFIKEYNVWNVNKEMEIETLKSTQIYFMNNILNRLELQYDSIYNINGELNFLK